MTTNVKTLNDVLADSKSFTSRLKNIAETRGLLPPLEVAKLTKKEQAALDASIRRSKKGKTKDNSKAPARDEAQTPPYAILPLLPYLPKDWLVWESASNNYGFLGQALRSLGGYDVIETGLETTGTNFLETDPKGDVQLTNPPFSIKYKWLEKTFENNQPFALLMPFDTWAAASAQRLFQKHGINVILLNRRVHFHMPLLGWGEYDKNNEPIRFKDANGKWKTHESKSDYSVAWFTRGLPHLKEPVTYGRIPLTKNLPTWMYRPRNKKEIEEGAKNFNRFTINYA